MAKVQQTVYLITEKQRNALVNYLQNRPYGEVAAGIQFLLNAPTAVLNVDTPEEQSAPTEPELKLDESVLKLDRTATPSEELALFS